MCRQAWESLVCVGKAQGGENSLGWGSVGNTNAWAGMGAQKNNCEPGVGKGPGMLWVRHGKVRGWDGEPNQNLPCPTR